MTSIDECIEVQDMVDDMIENIVGIVQSSDKSITSAIAETYPHLSELQKQDLQDRVSRSIEALDCL